MPPALRSAAGGGAGGRGCAVIALTRSGGRVFALEADARLRDLELGVALPVSLRVYPGGTWVALDALFMTGSTDEVLTSTGRTLIWQRGPERITIDAPTTHRTEVAAAVAVAARADLSCGRAACPSGEILTVCVLQAAVMATAHNVALSSTVRRWKVVSCPVEHEWVVLGNSVLGRFSLGPI